MFDEGGYVAGNPLKVHYFKFSLFSHQTLSSQMLSLFKLTCLPKKTNSFCSSSCNTRKIGYFDQFLPLFDKKTDSLSYLNSNERRRVVVGLSRIIKQGQGYILKGFAKNFCPYILVKIMKSLEYRETAFGFFKFAFQDDSDEIVKSSCVAAHVLAAQNLKLLAQDVVYWIIRRVGNDRRREVVEFMWKRHAEFESDFSVLDTLMRGFLKVEMSCEALEIVGRMREVGLRPSSSAITILLKLLLRVGDHGSVWKLLRGMIHQGPRPCNHNFNAVILGFCRLGHVKVGESLLYVMQKFKCQPDVYAYNILINAYCTRGQTVDALGWMHFMINNGCAPSLVTFGTVINAFCNQGNMIEARKLFDGMKEAGHFPNVISYNTLMNGYVKARDIGQANMLYEEMKNKAIAPDCTTFNILVAGHYRYGREEDSDRLLRDLSQPGSLPVTSLYNICVSGLCWAGWLDEAMKFLEDMLEKGITPTVVAFNSIIAAYSKAGLEEKAYEAYIMMVKFGLFPSSLTCSSLIMGLSKLWKLQEARDLLYEMIEKAFPSTKQRLLSFWMGTSGWGNVAGAYSLWNEMKGRGGYILMLLPFQPLLMVFL
ncbi:hypothetical protein OIU76_006057 [Salix suchowensis]|nr:hypothetical protein OIU76_006057 [Salix suchowensis]